jgi:hypothetical protein
MSLATYEEIVRNFDAARLRVPVIAGWLPDRGITGAGPGHWSFLPPVGEVVGVDHDGLNLWVQWRPIIDPQTNADRIASLIREGFTERSIGMERMRASGEWRLFHIALLSMGESPRIENMPRLGSVSREDRAAEWQVFSDAAEERQDRDQDRDYYQLRTCDPAAPAEEDFVMPLSTKDTESLRTMFAELVEPLSKTLTDLGSKVETLEQTTEERQTAADEEKRKVEEEREANAEKEEKRLLSERDRLQSEAVRRGVRPDKVQAFVDAFAWEEPTEAQVKQLAAGLDAIPVTVGDRVAVEVMDAEGRVVGHFDADRHFKLGSLPTSYDREEAALVARILSAAPRKSGKLEDPQAVLAQIREAAGAGSPRLLSI